MIKSYKGYLKTIEQIEKHNKLYYVDDEPTISDAEYDIMFKSVEHYENNHPDKIVEYSPTKSVGGKTKGGFEKVKFEKPMLSLPDLFTETELREWDAKVKKRLDIDYDLDYCCELKLDGLAVEIRYGSGGLLELASTRGNGRIGENITANVKAISNVPLRLQSYSSKLKVPKGLVVRGEVFMDIPGFNWLNKQLLAKNPDAKLHANVRNSAAGTMRQFNPEIVRSRPVYFSAYASTTLEEHDQLDQLEILTKLGIPTAPHTEVVKGAAGIMEYYQKIMDIRDILEFAIDGIVIKVNESHDRLELGEQTRHPNWAAAFKFPAMECKSVVEDVIFQVGRTGVVVPVAKIKPVEIGGVQVSSVTLHNQDEFNRYNLHEDDIVTAIRAGDVIPAITVVHDKLRSNKANRFSFPVECPSCHSTLVRVKSETRCLNDLDCPAQLIRGFEHFVSKAGMNIVGLSTATLQELIDNFNITEFWELYKLSNKNLNERTSLGPKESINLKEALKVSLDCNLNNLIYSLGIKKIGSSTSVILANHYKNIENLINSNFDELLELPDIGETIVNNLKSYFSDKSRVKALRKLLACGVNVKEFVDIVENPFKGKTIVITGSFPNRTRTEIEAELTNLGAKLSKSVSTKTDYVLVGEKPGSSYDKALKLKLEIITEI